MMNFKRLGALIFVLVAFVAASQTVFGAYVYKNYPNFTVPWTQSCISRTSAPQYCSSMSNPSDYYVGNAALWLSDLDLYWATLAGPSWGTAERLDAMCIAYYESGGKYVYEQGDNYQVAPSLQYDSWRFDYGLMSINSGHTSYDPIYLVSGDGSYSMAAAEDLYVSNGYDFDDFYTFDAFCSEDRAYEEWKYISTPTCSYNPSAGYWDVWSGVWAWVWHLGYPGDHSDGLMWGFC